MLKIITHPDPILRKKSKEIDLAEIKNPEFKNFLSELAETMQKKDGVGLASPQIGKNIRVVVVSKNKKPLFMINPEITKKSWAKYSDEEGCLSVPGKFGKVNRHKKINCIYFDENGRKQKISAQNFLARVIQHEIDHLDGILFIDKSNS